MTRTLRATLASLVAFILTLTTAYAADNTWDFSVQVSSSVQASPARITLSWPQDTNGTPSSYTIFRRAPSSTNWGAGTTLSGSATSYSDSNVAVGNAYEYRIVKAAGSYTGYGYIHTGINAPLVDSRGKVVLVVDSSIASPLAAELARLQQDLAGDGWIVLRRDVARTDSVASVKAVIKAAYNTDPANVKSVFLFGHVAVPYSGQFNPDGHPDHIGAWPADAFYGDMDGTWSDSSVNYKQTLNTNPTDAARMSNVPGDGKMDPKTLPSAVELQVGRVDLANMPGRTTWGGPATFATETELLRKYLNKDHNFRQRNTSVPRRAILGDYFGQRGGEAFAASGFRNFAPLVGTDNIRNLNIEFNDTKGVWIPQLGQNSYLFAYGCGAGSYASIAGLGNTGLYNDGNTVEMVQANVRGVFNLLFGSWLGDWDNEDNILRAPLATDHGLVSVWSGRPHWFMHALGQGETVGYTARVTMNNAGDYQTAINSAQNRVHVALMGDPTLRLHPVVPATNLNGAASESSIALSWTASNDSAIVGYHVYRGSIANGFTRITSSPVAATNYADSNGSTSAAYMVRAIKLEDTTSGSYYNASQGAFWNVDGSGGGSTTPAPASDATAPTIVISAPAGGTTVSGTSVTVSATASDNVAVTGVQLKLDGANLGSELTTAPYSTTINSTTLTNGSHTLSAVGRDAAGNMASASTVSITVSNTASGGTASGGTTSGGTISGATNSGGTTTTPTGTPVVTVVATDGNAAIGVSSDTATLTFTRAGSTDSAITVIYSLSGTAGKWTDYRRIEGDMPVAITIPAGASSATMTLLAYANSNNVAVPTAIFTLANGSGYTVGATNSATITLAAATSTAPTIPSVTVVATNPSPSTTAPATTELILTFSPSAVVTAPVVTTPPTSPAPSTTTETVWFDDALPLGASGSARGDVWLWVDQNPAPFSGRVSHQSTNAKGIHEHQFNWATQKLPVKTGDKLFVYVYIDPVNTPRTLMVSWCSNNWEHRAYWGENKIAYGKNNSASQRYMGAMPATGQWVRLEVPASAVGLEGHTLIGMGFHLYDGQASWDRTGTDANTTMPSTDTSPPVVSVAAPDANAAVGVSTDTATLTFSRTGSTAASIVVNYTLSGTAGKWTDYRRPEGDMPVEITIPAGAASAMMKLVAMANSNNVTNPSAIFTLANGTGYTVGTPSTATVTLAAVPTAPAPSTGPSAVTIAAIDGSAVVGNTSDTATIAFTRTGGDTSKDLVINYVLGGNAAKWTDYRRVEGDMPVSFTLPAGATSRVMTIAAHAISSGASSATATFTLSPDAAYTIGSANTAALTIASSGSSSSGGSGSSGGSTPPPPSTTTLPTTTAPAPTPPVETAPTTPITVPNSLAENSAIRIPQVGEHQLRVLTPTVLELQRITSGATDWNFVSSGALSAPAVSKFIVTANGQPVSVSSVGFRRRVAYGALLVRDLRVDNSIILTLGSGIPEGATVEVKSADTAIIPSNFAFKVTADALRYSPAIHVNQEGYVPGFAKKAMIGYYLGSRGELDVDASAGFKIVNAATGATVHTGSLTVRKDVGYAVSPLPYQKVLQADFTSFQTPGEYMLLVPGLGTSFPFVIDEGVAMAFNRAYAMGLFHQRCGAECAMPYTRFTHAACHMLPADVPSGAGYDYAWSVIAGETGNAKDNPRHTAPRLMSESTMLYPFVNRGKIDVSGGHHDAGDYSKYTINVAHLVHQLAFNADSIAGAKSLDNLGFANSGDGISDILQEAKHEADFLAKLQDADGGFYFLVYPKNRRYESDVTPDKGDAQIVWPKTTSVTAAGVAALAQMASSPAFKAAYPTEAAAYLNKAKLGWQFLINAIAKHGKDGSYQKITHYGNEFMHDDELAWAACEMHLATGEPQYAAKLQEWFPNPADQNTMRWTWVRLWEGYGNAIRSYAFAARSGRLSAGQLNATYLAACENQIKLAGDDMLRWTNESAYGTPFADHTKRVMSAGWYFSLDQGTDMAVAYQLNPKQEYIDALVSNMNYEGGTNPVNVTFITGLGLKRQREVVNQWALNDTRVLPPIGFPSGNIVGSYSWVGTYGTELNDLSFPSTASSGTGYPLQDRYSDVWNVTAELVTVNQARALVATTMLAAQTTAKSTAWKPSTTAKILASATSVAVGQSVTLSLDGSVNVAGARITWEARDQQPDFGSTFTIKPKNSGSQWVEVEITYADGRRIFGAATYTAQ